MGRWYRKLASRMRGKKRRVVRRDWFIDTTLSDATQANTDIFDGADNQKFTLVRLVVTKAKIIPIQPSSPSTNYTTIQCFTGVQKRTNVTSATQVNLSAGEIERVPNEFIWHSNNYKTVRWGTSAPDSSINMLEDSGTYDTRTMRKIADEGHLTFSAYYAHMAGDTAQAVRVLAYIIMFFKDMG